MTRKTILTATTIFFICLFFLTCKRDHINCTDEESFCSLVNAQNFNATGPIINDFLETLNYNYDLST
jgi:hypothetical protein